MGRRKGEGGLEGACNSRLSHILTLHLGSANHRYPPYTGMILAGPQIQRAFSRTSNVASNYRPISVVRAMRAVVQRVKRASVEVSHEQLLS